MNKKYLYEKNLLRKNLSLFINFFYKYFDFKKIEK
jgi:hypothetical protein